MWQWAIDHPDFIVLAIQLPVLGVIWLLKRSFATNEDVDAGIARSRAEIDTLLAKQDLDLKSIGAAAAKTAGDLSLLDQTIKGLPSSDDINEIRLSISKLEGEFKAISTNVGNVEKHIGSIGRSVDRIEDWLMTGKGKST
jgi:hypothetical protein